MDAGSSHGPGLTGLEPPVGSLHQGIERSAASSRADPTVLELPVVNAGQGIERSAASQRADPTVLELPVVSPDQGIERSAASQRSSLFSRRPEFILATYTMSGETIEGGLRSWVRSVDLLLTLSV
jgi:hypothetical protein